MAADSLFHWSSVVRDLSDGSLGWIELVLRIGVFGIFVGHGTLAFCKNEKWLPYLATAGFNKYWGLQVMPLIGLADIFAGFCTLVTPQELILVWATVWAFSTALIRPFSGEDIWSFVERAGNWACPLALLLLRVELRAPNAEAFCSEAKGYAMVAGYMVLGGLFVIGLARRLSKRKSKKSKE